MAHYEAKARAVGRLGVAIGAMAGAAVGSVPLSPLRAAWPIPSNFGFATILGGLFVGVMIGYVIGDGRAQLYHRMAEQACLQLLLEERVSENDERMAQLLTALTARAAAAVQAQAALQPQQPQVVRQTTAGRGGSPPVPPHGRRHREPSTPPLSPPTRQPSPKRGAVRARLVDERLGRARRPRPPPGARARRRRTASTDPRPPRACRPRPTPSRRAPRRRVPNPWWWCDLTGARSPSSAPTRLPAFNVDVVVGEDAGRVLVLLVADDLRAGAGRDRRRARRSAPASRGRRRAPACRARARP